MEVQADVQKERCSLSGESATVSLGTISDNASTKAMAGSILNAYMPLERSAIGAYLSYMLQQHISDLFLCLNHCPSFSSTFSQMPCGQIVCFLSVFTLLVENDARMIQGIIWGFFNHLISYRWSCLTYNQK